MSTIQIYEAALHYKNKGLNVIPTDENKQPTVKSWGIGISIPLYKFKSSYGLGLVMENMIAFDFDLKYLVGETPLSFMSRVKELIPTELLDKMYIQSTKNNGYHFICRVNNYKLGNRILAQRHTTEEEKHDTYIKNYEKYNSFDKASQIASADKCRVLIETRANNGYVCIVPTPGYKHVYGTLNEYSLEEIDELTNIFKSFNTYHPKTKLKEVIKESETDSLIDWFNGNGDVLRLLIDFGWEKVGDSDSPNNIRLKRPGTTYSKSSALFDSSTRVFSVFSTSTIFDNSKSYSPYMVLWELFNGDYFKVLNYIKNECKNNK